MLVGIDHIGVIGALPEEVDHVRDRLEGRTTARSVGRDFDTGTLAGRNVTLVESRIGKVAAAITAATLIRDFAVDAIVFTGIAGAIDDALAVGDLVVADQLVQHDLAGPPELFERGEIPLLGIRSIEADPQLREAAVAASTDFLAGGLADVVADEHLAELGVGRPAVHVGTVATGDEFIHGTMKAMVRERTPEAIAVDMEGAAVAQVCHEHGGVPVCVIRSISDLAGGTASVDFPLFLDTLARHYSVEILERMLAR